MDVHTKQQRQRNMQAIRGRDTRPEMFVRRLVHSMGYRYRLHGRNLPGHPDLVFASKKKILFVHGCFWHRHCCKYGRVVPATRRQLRALGWKSLTIWECELKQENRLANRIRFFLDA
jgi:DNA mismatch endonuclease (patch repair protein)